MVNRAPITEPESNTNPVADAGADQTVDANETVTLDGSGSSDADSDSLTYLWTAPSGIVLSDATAVNPTFTAPEYTTATDLVFSLTVNDGEADSDSDEIMVTVMTATVSNCSSLKLETIISNESCLGEADGSITFVVNGGVAPYEYSIGELTITSIIIGLSAGDYVVGVTDANGCVIETNVTITTFPELAVTTSVDVIEEQVSIQLTGSDTYFITLNDDTLETTNDTVVLPLSAVNNTLRVTTDNECQGVFEDTIVLDTNVLISPNPITDGSFSIRNISAVDEPVYVQFFSIDGKLLFQKLYQEEESEYQFYIGIVQPGIYVVKISTLKEVFYEKVLVN